MIQRLLQEVKEYKKASLLAPALMVGEVVMELMLPFLMSFIIDSGVNQGYLFEIGRKTAVWLAMGNTDKKSGGSGR